MLVWILRFRGGLSLKSNDLRLLLNAHHFFMLLGPIICVGQAIMAFKMIPGRRRVRKVVHMFLNLAGLVLGVLGFFAIFTFLNKEGTMLDLDSLHSWLGFGTMCLFAIQFLLGFTFFLFPGATLTMRAIMKPWHFFFGLTIFILAIISSATGIVRRFSLIGLRRGSETLVLNFTGIAIILYGITVILSVILP
ncbi:putative ascorbate-specific transmembrane electron transporter 1 [Dendrobium catenatum]|uniref:Putative ascorbate-specific transmembrane electron transporter 1 n=1 Tax=Dendrobium catenatum TaxID=906689 RepID=A0A2I0VY35_9ASPA|nr:putative ascorbate-specific transmembrane electron transporter 1 [Dendrobium catenatum]